MSGAFPRSGTKGSESDNEVLTAPPGWRHSEGKNYAIAAVGEFLGTFLFLFFAFAGTQCAKLAYDPLKREQGIAEEAVPTVGLLLYVALAFGMSLAVNVWIFYRVSGGLFNPAVTVSVMVLGKMPVVKGAMLIASQLLGGVFAAGLVEILLPGNLSVGTGLSSGINTAQGLFLEAFLTFELTMTILMLAVEKHRATFMAPLGIGLALFIAHLTGIFFTGASLNPARSFGPAVITRDFPTYHWIYWIGPCLGSVAASGFYKLLLLLEYKTANPGQDDDGLNYGYPIIAPVEHTRGSGSTGRAVVGHDEISAIRGSEAV